ncbi:MAG: hypothetical protein DI527_07540 [Chelatococcus sp.]|nr:MAG: hypothetical protein DI527_07540 [Chelatococcus sp.]
MALHRDNEAVAPLINGLSLQTTTALVGALRVLAEQGHSTDVATTIVLDAVLLSAVSLLKTAVNNDLARVTLPIGDVLHRRLDELLKMEFRVHAPLPDGSFDPVGQRIS